MTQGKRPAPTRLQIAKADIIKLFEKMPQRVLRQKDLSQILEDNREFWRATKGTTVQAFSQFLLTSTKLSKITLPFPRPYARETRFIWGDVDLREVMLTLKPNCHFSHYSAMQLHGLTEQVPKTTYINFEQQLASNPTGELSQKNIDTAFRRPVRSTKYIAETEQFRVCILNGKNTGYLGVEELDHRPAGGGRRFKIRATGIERTLIDIAVRPIYSGGVFEVLKAYQLARETVSVNKLAAMLQKLRFIYPYHQVIGYYLERSGYRSPQIDLLRRFPMEFDFYLEHNMKRTEFVKAWRLFVPKGF